MTSRYAACGWIRCVSSRAVRFAASISARRARFGRTRRAKRSASSRQAVAASAIDADVGTETRHLGGSMSMRISLRPSLGAGS